MSTVEIVESHEDFWTWLADKLPSNMVQREHRVNSRMVNFMVEHRRTGAVIGELWDSKRFHLKDESELDTIKALIDEYEKYAKVQMKIIVFQWV